MNCSPGLCTDGARRTIDDRTKHDLHADEASVGVDDLLQHVGRQARVQLQAVLGKLLGEVLRHVAGLNRRFVDAADLLVAVQIAKHDDRRRRFIDLPLIVGDRSSRCFGRVVVDDEEPPRLRVAARGGEGRFRQQLGQFLFGDASRRIILPHGMALANDDAYAADGIAAVVVDMKISLLAFLI